MSEGKPTYENGNRTKKRWVAHGINSHANCWSKIPAIF
jgi:hypothetical protein